jgi:DNA-binding NarL/FixJ family response regulator
MRFLIADDQVAVRRGLREILANALPGVEFSEAGNGDEVLSHLERNPTNLLVLDIGMLERGGMDVLRDVKRACPRLPVIILSCQPEEQYAVDCLRAGAAAFINKESAPDELAVAAKNILRGGRYVSASLALKQIASLDESAGKPLHELLSIREYEVMKMIAAGIPLTEIGDRLQVSVKDICACRAGIMVKMHLKSNAELIRYSMMNSLFD